MRQFATRRDRSALVIRSRKDGSTKTVAPHKFYTYQSNETRTLNKAINRKPRRN
jgi:hypothetical protein